MTIKHFLMVLGCLAFLGGEAGAGFFSQGGELQSGLKSSLVPLQSQYMLGQPMKFQVQISNQGGIEATLDCSPIMGYGNAISVRGPGDATNRFLGASNATLNGCGLSIKSGDTQTLVEFDLNSDYWITVPGKYVVQFQPHNTVADEQNNLPASKPITVTVLPGPMTASLFFKTHMLQLPRNPWKIEFSKGLMTSTGNSNVGSDCAIVTTDKNFNQFTVCQTSQPVVGGGESLGKNSWGFVYLTIPPKTDKLLPSLRHDLIKAFGLSTPNSH